jgi:cytochrome b561
MALVVFATIPAGLVMMQPGLDRALQNALFLFHKNIGVVMLVLIVARLVYRRQNPPPPLPAHVSPIQQRVAGATHAALYLLLLLIPVAGYVRVKAGGFPLESLDALGVPSLVPRSDALAEIAKTAHYLGGLAFAALVAAHVGAALFHGIVKRDGVFSRMWPPVGGRSD